MVWKSGTPGLGDGLTSISASSLIEVDELNGIVVCRVLSEPAGWPIDE
jgi:hypothetical protein